MNYDLIIEQNGVLLSKVVDYICNTRKIEKNDIVAAPKMTVKDLFYHIRKEQCDIENMRRSRDKIQEDLYYIEKNAGVSSQCTDTVSGGRDNGLRTNPVYNRLIQIEKMKEEIIQSTYDILLIEKGKEEKRKMIRDFIYIIPQIQYSRIIEATYFDLMDDDSIAAETNYEYDSIRIFRMRAIKELATILKNYILELQ